MNTQNLGLFTRNYSAQDTLVALRSFRSLAKLLVWLGIFCLAFTAASERELPRRGKDFALFIAVNDYQYWGKLRHPISEVERIAQELEQNYDFETRILRNPSQEQIINVLREYNAKLYANDAQLLIYLSGHGSFDELTKEGFFIPLEGRLNDVAQTSYLSFSRLKNLVENIPCNHILLAIDACYSGTFDKLVAVRGDIFFGRPGAASNERDRFIARELTLRSRIFIASGKKEQTPDASNFAAYFLKALRNGGGDDAIVSIQELEAELIKAQPKPHISVFGDHQRESNFLFIKNLSAPVAPATIHNARQDVADWQEAQRLNIAAAYRDYLRKQPQGDFRSLAEQKSQTLEGEEREIAAWNDTKKRNTCEAYKTFLREYPRSAYRPLAEEGEKQTCRSSLATPIARLETDMVRVAGGSFTMGCKDAMRDGSCDDDEKPAHTIRVSNFSIGKYEVTQAQWRAVMDSDPSSNKGCDECPVEQVSWNDIQDFLKKLNVQTGKRYRLPTEAEWEYAARGALPTVGRGYLYSGSNTVNEVAWYSSNSDSETRPVGGKKPNELGLYDMSGNVWEWCEDDWHSNYNGAPTDGSVWVDSSRGSLRVGRGGSWDSTARFCRAAARGGYTPAYRDYSLGFRLAL